MNGSNGNSSTPRFRLAPTPSGLLHRGNAASFVLTWLLTRTCKGGLLLRIDDLDRERFRTEYLDDIFRTIDWLGIDYDLGPSGPDDFLQNWSQTLRMESYQALLKNLQLRNRIYACDCSRSKLSKGSPCTCRGRVLPGKGSYSLRFNSTGHETIHFNDLMKGEVRCNLQLSMGDFIVRKKDQKPSYQIASLCDDVQFDITHVVRGEDLISSTAAQLALDSELNQANFSKSCFIHHPLITGETGSKLSKSAGDALIKRGQAALNQLPGICKLVGEWLGLQEPIGRIDELRDASRKPCLQLLRLSERDQ